MIGSFRQVPHPGDGGRCRAYSEASSTVAYSAAAPRRRAALLDEPRLWRLPDVSVRWWLHEWNEGLA